MRPTGSKILSLVLLIPLALGSALVEVRAAHGGPEALGVNDSFTGNATIITSPGTSLTVSIDVKDMPEFNGFDIRIGFDSLVLDATLVDFSACFGPLPLFVLFPTDRTNPEESPGVVRIALAVTGGFVSGSRCLAKISFTTLATASNSLIDVGLDDDTDPTNDLNLIVSAGIIITHDTFDAVVNLVQRVVPGKAQFSGGPNPKPLHHQLDLSKDGNLQTVTAEVESTDSVPIFVGVKFAAISTTGIAILPQTTPDKMLLLSGQSTVFRAEFTVERVPVTYKVKASLFASQAVRETTTGEFVFVGFPAEPVDEETFNFRVKL